MSCKNVSSKEVLHFTERLTCNIIYVCIARKFLLLATKRSLYEYEHPDQSKHMGAVLRKVASFTPRVFFVCSSLSHPPQRKGVTRWMWLDLAQTFSNNTCLRLYVSASLRVVRPHTQTPSHATAHLSNPFKHPFNAAFQVSISLPVSASTCPCSDRLVPSAFF